MTDATNLGDIYVVGQRRAPGGTFPSGGGGGGGQGEDPGVQQNEVTDPTYVPPPNPCDNPDAALEWNADAAAAEAAKEFARQAAARNPPETLNVREWGCYLYRAADGSIQLGLSPMETRFPVEA